MMFNRRSFFSLFAAAPIAGAAIFKAAAPQAMGSMAGELLISGAATFGPQISGAAHGVAVVSGEALFQGMLSSPKLSSMPSRDAHEPDPGDPVMPKRGLSFAGI